MALGALTMQNSASWQKQAWATLLLVLAGGLNLASWLPRSLLPFPIWYGMLAFAGLVLLEVLWGGMVNRRFWHFPRTPLDFALLITGLQIGVSLYATYDLAQSLPKVYGLSSSLLVFLTLQRWVQLGRWQWWLGLVGYITAGVVVAVLGGSAAKVLPTALAMHLPALFELNANELGGVLLWFAPLAAVCSLIALLNIQKRWWLILPAARRGDSHRAYHRSFGVHSLTFSPSWFGIGWYDRVCPAADPSKGLAAVADVVRFVGRAGWRLFGRA
jgi:hypothetical protein